MGAMVNSPRVSRINRFRRLTVRYERRADLQLAFLLLSRSLVCWHAL
jgi:hypothetical protein